MKRDWDRIYAEKRTPWDIERPDRTTIDLVERITKPCRMLDVGCGTGNESIYLAKKGFDVTGIDISNLAIKKAKKKAKRHDVKIKFLVKDVTKSDYLKGKFDFILDKACFHFVEPEKRKIYIKNLKSLLKRDGKFLLIVSSWYDRKILHITGPYSFTKKDLMKIFSKDFKIIETEMVDIKDHKLKPRAYFSLMKLQ